MRVLHANDALAVASSAEVLRSFGRVDVLLGHYGGAGPFPQAFPDIVDKPAHARRIAHQFLHRLAAAAELVGARYVMPFAGQYQLGGHLAPLNADRSVVPLGEAVAWLEEHCSATAISLQPFKAVHLRNGELGAEWVEPSDEVLSDYLARIETSRYPYERDDEGWSNAYEELGGAFQRVAERYEENVRSGLKVDSTSIQIVADPALAVVGAGSTDLPGHALTLDFGADRLGGGVDREPRSESLTRISVDPRLLRRLLARSPGYHGFTQMHWNQAEIGSHLRWRRQGPHDTTAHGFLNFLA